MVFLRRLGLKRNEVRLEEFTKEWIEEFEKTKEVIIQAIEFPEERIQHIGSTSIEGMKAKPIIDIVLGVEDINNISEDRFIQLKSIGFHQLKVEMENEIVLAKFMDDTFEVKTHYIHLTDFEGKQWKEYMIFKELLQNNSNVREEYIVLKERYITEQTTGIKEYTEYKGSFIREIIGKKI